MLPQVENLLPRPRVSSKSTNLDHLTLHVICAWATFETFLQNSGTAYFDQSSLTFDRSSFAILHSKFLQNTQFKLTLKQTLSKPKPRFIVLIMVCQHIQNEVLIHLVPIVLEPNNFNV